MGRPRVIVRAHGGPAPHQHRPRRHRAQRARAPRYPDPVLAAQLCEAAGADGITAHLREDRRHIVDDDVVRLRAAVATLLNLEMAATDEMIAIAEQVKPDVITLVPERRAGAHDRGRARRRAGSARTSTPRSRMARRSGHQGQPLHRPGHRGRRGLRRALGAAAGRAAHRRVLHTPPSRAPVAPAAAWRRSSAASPGPPPRARAGAGGRRRPRAHTGTTSARSWPSPRSGRSTSATRSSPTRSSSASIARCAICAPPSSGERLGGAR